jgi:transposase
MMSEHGGKTYRPWEPERYQHEAQSPAAKLPEGDVVFFLLDTVRRLDLSRFYAPYEQETRGAPPFDPAMMVCLLLYAYCVGVFSSRKIALACERNLAFIAIVGQERPDFRTISDFRKLHLEAFKDVFVHVVRLAGEMGLVRLGNVATDGTKRQGHASRHQAMSYGDMQQAAERLREASAALVRQASQQDAAEEAALGRRRGDARPTALARRAERLVQIEAAMRRVETPAQADAQVERQRRAAAEAERARTGTPRRGKAPHPVVEPPDAKAQRHCTEPARHSMRTHQKGWDSCGNAPARVDAPGQMILACDVTDASNDTQPAEPMAQATLSTLAHAGIERPQTEAGAAQALPAPLDKGSDSEAAVEARERGGFDPYIATERQRHHTPPAAASAPPAAAQERRAATVRTLAGRALYARRKVIVAPVCGQSKAVRGFRRFLLRGLAKIRGEGRWVCLPHNLLQIWRYGCAPNLCEPEAGPLSGGCAGPWEGVSPS